MAELISYVCPNCGANTTNAHNCDYCGSLLVRFVERNIDLSGTSYLNNDKVIPGLIKHLEQNLLTQKNSEESVVTDIYAKINNGFVCISVLRQGKALWMNNTRICISDQTDGLLVCFVFDPFSDSGHENYNSEINQLERKFKNLPSFDLFTPNRSYYTDNDGNKRKSSEYAIYFGHDAEGAARIISEVIEKVYGLNHDDNSIEIYTNSGHDNIEKSRQAYDDNFYGRSSVDDYYEEDEDSTFSIFGIPWYWLFAAISAFIYFIL